MLLFRMAEGAAVKHCAILSDLEGPEPRMIHAYWGRSVVESWMGPWWRRRLAAVFRFPGSSEWRRWFWAGWGDWSAAGSGGSSAGRWGGSSTTA
ncbi:hypothetical protein MU852_05495 [Brevundimonas albigilva]|uniref:hypothetical protein n=1 Tax=Brevundimonas albigilva TaxID=1312364 RepID=UPI00201B8500|nr:hypothetical protein [Brevundimonas albigilva]UQV19264.1 hypothetical protein MU852_05495 [Brevundimonas albigilva]